MASTAARAPLPAISATNSSTLRVKIVCICANWSSESRDDRVSSGCCDVVGLLTTVGVEIAACFSSREIKTFRGLATSSRHRRHRDAEDLPYHSRSY